MKEIKKEARVIPGMLSNFSNSTYLLQVEFTQEEMFQLRLPLTPSMSGKLKIKIEYD